MARTRQAATPKSVEELVLHALKAAASNPKAAWTGKSAKAIFNTNEANHEAAIAECTKPNAPLLKPVDKGGVLTAAGFERIAGALPPEEVRSVYDQLRDELPEDQVGVVARSMARLVPPGERVGFIEGVIRRTPAAITELIPALEEAKAAAAVEHEARIAAAARRKAEEDAILEGMARARQIIAEIRQARRDALKREYEAEGGDPADLQEPERKPPESEKPPSAKGTGTAHNLKTAEETDFRRNECDRLAAAWRDAWDAKKAEGAEALVDAMWNIRGFRMIGEAGATTEFNARYHESEQSLMSGQVKIVRPGWMLKEEDGEYVALKAAVVKT